MNENIIENMKICAGAMAEMIRMFYVSLVNQGFSEKDALQLTSDYMKAVFGK